MQFVPCTPAQLKRITSAASTYAEIAVPNVNDDDDIIIYRTKAGYAVVRMVVGLDEQNHAVRTYQKSTVTYGTYTAALEAVTKFILDLPKVGNF